MLDWLKRTSSDRGLANPEGVPEDVIDVFARDIAELQSVSPDLPELALKYVIDGVGAPRTIIRVASNDRPVFFCRRFLRTDPVKLRNQLYDEWDRIAPTVAMRFGNLLAATFARYHRYQLLLAIEHPWIEALALDLLQPEPHPHAEMARLEVLLERCGEARTALVISIFHSVDAHRWNEGAGYWRNMPGFGASVRASADSLRPVFRTESVEHRLYALMLLENAEAATLAAFAEELVALSIESNRRLREPAVLLALRLGAPALQIARRQAQTQKPEQRALALKLLWESGDPHEREFVIERGDTDSADSVRKAVQQLRSGARVQAAATFSFAIPEVTPDRSPLGEESRGVLRAALETLSEIIHARKQQRVARGDASAAHWKGLSASEITTIVRQVAEPGSGSLERFGYMEGADPDAITKAQLSWIARGDVQLGHVVRLLVSTCRVSDFGGFSIVGSKLLGEYGRMRSDASLLELAARLETYGISREILLRDWYSTNSLGFMKRWPASGIWPLFARYRDMIDVGFAPPSQFANQSWFAKDRVFDALATFPETPADLIPKLMELALGSVRAERVAGQRALDRTPGKETYIIEALTAGKTDTRIAASTWLAQLRCSEAIPHIERALLKEKNDAAAGAHMSALEALGVPVDRFLNREGLQKDAQRVLAKGIPADLAWFPFDGLPEVHWDDNGERVPDASLRWFVVQSCKLKSPEPGGVLRKYCASFRRAEREALGLYVLNSWLHEDLKPIARAEAESRARAEAQRTISYAAQFPQYYAETYGNTTEQQLFESFLAKFVRQPAGSAIGAKGLLAITAACGGPEIARVVQRYLKEYYGTRAAQGKALIQMLAWIDHPTATQLVLSVGSRFRTKGFQEEAARQAQLLAGRKGWTLEELADRTIPSAGFDENAECVVDYGARRFTARLAADFSVELYTQENKKITSLPDARKDEDEAVVKELKKQFTAAKKELKDVLQAQRERLYEALCTQRRWKSGDWMLYLNRHPIVRRYCQQLVWLALRADTPVATFRPLDDGTLTDVKDSSFELAPDVEITLAHDSNVASELSTAWRAHLDDYKIEPLFQQFGKHSYRLPADQRDATDIEDFKGFVLDAFKLRNRLGKLGYTRGAAEDSGWFFRYEKRFPTLGLTATLQFTGNSLPEEDRRAALVSLWFAGSETQGYANKRALGEIPAVLLSECWNDMRLAAAEGAFDADWEKQAQY